MKLFTTASYYGTGSSAITDLLSEYEGVKALDSSFECRIAHDMFGLSDLEYYLVENNHRHNSSVAINQFIRLCGIYGLDKHIRFEDYPGHFPHFKESVEAYINTLAPFGFKGGAHTDIYTKSDLFIMILKFKDLIYHKLHKPILTIEDSTWASKGITPYEKVLHESDYHITALNKEEFIEATLEFTDSLFKSVQDNDAEYLMVDQLVQPINTMRYVKYFRDIKVICVDRDPRDIYYNEKYFWRGGVAPTDPHLFVEWYKATRRHKKTEKDDPEKVMRIQFEDLICDYNHMVDKIESFLGLTPNNHIRPQTKLNPSVSVKNIAKWKNDTMEEDNIHFIKDSLMDYYEFK